ncbi:MAG: YlbF family regulator [Clostridia bacterium]|nr:YlbF family regulator [Clostridia bacterium]
MDIFEKTRELGEMIQESELMKRAKDLEAKQQSDEEASALLKEFELNRLNLARDMQNGKLSREEAIQKNNQAFDELCEKSPIIREYIEAKQQFDAMVQQVNQILNYYITGTDPNCTHDCSTCGGCH